MKYFITALILISIGWVVEGMAQDSANLTIKKISFKTIVHTNSLTKKGYLSHINDSLINISTKPVKFNALAFNENETGISIPYENINKITISRNGSGLKGALIGGLSGMILGVVAGFIAGDDPEVPASEDFLGLRNAFRTTAAEKALGGGVLGLAAGGIIGCIIGNLAKKKFIIGGKKKNFQDMRQAILNRAYTKNTESSF